MTVLLVSLYSVLGVLIVAVEVRRMRKGETLDALSFFNKVSFYCPVCLISAHSFHTGLGDTYLWVLTRQRRQ